MICQSYKKLNDAAYRDRRIHEGWCKGSRETVSCNGDINYCEYEEVEERSGGIDDEAYEALAICEPKWVHFQSGLVKCARYDFSEARLEVELNNVKNRDAVMLLSFAITSSIAVMAAQKVFEALQS